MHSSRMYRPLVDRMPESASGGGGVCVSSFWDTITPPPREQNDKQVQKYYLGHNFVAAGKNTTGVDEQHNTCITCIHWKL